MSHLLDAVALTTEETAVTYQKERDTLLAANEQLTKEVQDLQEMLAERNQAGGTGGSMSGGAGLKDKPEYVA